MGKQLSPRSPPPKSGNANTVFGAKDYQVRCSDNLQGSDPSIGGRILGGVSGWNSKVLLFHGLKNDCGKFSSWKGVYVGKKHPWLCRHVRSIAFVFLFTSFLFLLDSLVVSISGSIYLQISQTTGKSGGHKVTPANINEDQPPVQMYGRLVSLASSSLVEICNAVALASLLNATLVLPKFLYSNVWKDPSQFGDIYQEDYFMNALKEEVDVVKGLPPHLKSIDFEAIGSLINDSAIQKEAKKTDYLGIVLPLLLRNGVVHFLGFGNRLACWFLLVKRIRKYGARKSMLDKQLLGDFMANISSKEEDAARGPSRYLALHLRFEVDMVAYSMCDFSGGEYEKKELQAYRETHFPLLIAPLKNSNVELTSILLDLIYTEEIPGCIPLPVSTPIWSPRKLSSHLVNLHLLGSSPQLAALDFIICATSGVFAMADSGSQLSSLVSGFRTYYGGRHSPNLRPRLAAILSENSFIAWNSFEERVRKMIEEGQRVHVRGRGRSIYRQPRSPECMCKSQ